MKSLSDARQAKGMTFKMMGEALRVSASFVRNVEMGVTPIPKGRRDDWERAYGITLPKSEEWKSGYLEGYDDAKAGKERKV